MKLEIKNPVAGMMVYCGIVLAITAVPFAMFYGLSGGGEKRNK